MAYYDLPKSQLLVSEEEALFDRIFDDIEADAFGMIDSLRAGFTLAEYKKYGLRSWIRADISAARLARREAKSAVQVQS